MTTPEVPDADPAGVLIAAGIDLTGLDPRTAYKLGRWTFDQLAMAQQHGYLYAVELLERAAANPGEPGPSEAEVAARYLRTHPDRPAGAA